MITLKKYGDILKQNQHKLKDQQKFVPLFKGEKALLDSIHTQIIKSSDMNRERAILSIIILEETLDFILDKFENYLHEVKEIDKDIIRSIVPSKEN